MGHGETLWFRPHLFIHGEGWIYLPRKSMLNLICVGVYDDFSQFRVGLCRFCVKHVKHWDIS